MKILRPWGNTGDVDNYAKAIYDMMQPNEARGNTGIMTNDCLIIESTLRKYYSVTPRYEVTIQYMDKIPLELTKILRLRTFMDDI
jgi:Holliday junction resolvase RusA-like endonuclease